MQNERPPYPIDDVNDILVGKASRKKNWFRVFLTLASVVIIIFTISFIFFGDYKLPSIKSEKAESSVTIDRLVSAYSESPENFKKEYMKKTLKITGRIYEVNKTGNYVVMTTLNGDTLPTQTIVSFNDSKNMKKFYKLMTGEKIEVTGTIKAASMSAIQITADSLLTVEE